MIRWIPALLNPLIVLDILPGYRPLLNMSKMTETPLTHRHMDVLEYAWQYYRNNSIGPLYQNIQRNTGVGKAELGDIFPHGLNSVFSWIGMIWPSLTVPS